VSASLIERNYSGVTGGITYDTETNLEWLDLSFTNSMDLGEYQNYLSILDAGWKFANSAMVSNLLTNFDFTFNPDSEGFDIYSRAIDVGEIYTYNDPNDIFFQHVDEMTMLGKLTWDGGKWTGVKGFTSEHSGKYYKQYMAYYSTNGNTGVVSEGKFYREPKASDNESFFTYRESMFVERAPVNVPAENALAVELPEPATLGLFSFLLCFMGVRKYKK
jgi:hypothetical protein